jgi:tRNA(Ile)-lysidine synthase
MPALAAEGLTAERLARLARRVGRIEAALYEVSQVALRRIAPGPWPERGPVTIDAEDFAGLPEELQLRLLERAIDWTGDEGPVELGKLEALCEALVGTIDGTVPDLRNSRRFRRTLAGAVVTLHGGRLLIERAPSRRGASKRP